VVRGALHSYSSFAPPGNPTIVGAAIRPNEVKWVTADRSVESEGYRRRFGTNGAGGGNRVLCPPQGLANAPPVERGGRVDLELLLNFAPDLDSSGLTSPP
jgi:hypothetical protein